MKHAYTYVALALATLFLLPAARAQQAWRPFRPGLIYTYALRNGTDVSHTLRVDSAYQTAAGDSVYAFNRLMRQQTGVPGRAGYLKSRNNLFGARLSWTPGQGQESYVLSSDAQANVQAGRSLRIYPRVAVGQSWVASTNPLLTAVLQARSRLTILPGVQDSAVTIEMRSGTATTGAPLIGLTLSRSYGLIEATPWLGGAVAGTTVSAPLLAAVPVPLAQSPYGPLALFTMQPGDDLGYFQESFTFSPAPCDNAYTLRRIISRQQRPDSLVFTFQEQTRRINYGWSFCGLPAGTTISPVRTGRMAISLRTGFSSQYPALGLLSGEYRVSGPSSLPNPTVYYMGLGIVNLSGGSCLRSGAQLGYEREYLNSGGGGTYSPGLDAGGWRQHFAPQPGLGDIQTFDSGLVYYRRSVGTPLTCGSPINFANLLPTRAAQAALATLHPNPAAEQATLTLAQPARPGHALRLTDALGRLVWQAAVPVGQSVLAVPLAGQPAGLYMLHLNGSNGTTATWKLTHE